MNLQSNSFFVFMERFQATVILKNLLFVLPFIINVSLAEAQTTLWTGNSNSNWNNSANWSGSVPNGNSFQAILINGASHYPVITGTVNVGSIRIASAAELTIDAGGELNVMTNSSFIQDGLIDNFGELTNHGTINITGTVGSKVGIFNGGTFNNESTAPGGNVLAAVINIDGTTEDAISTSGTFRNQDGVINIGQNNSIAGDGILVTDGSFLTVTAFTNSPIAVNIDNTGGDGIEVLENGSFSHTAGSILIGANSTAAQDGIHNKGEFTSTAPITIARCGKSGIHNRIGATMVNSFNVFIGTLGAVGDNGIVNRGTLTNKGTIDIKRAAIRGIYNNPDGTMENKSGAELIIGSAEVVGWDGMENRGNFVNRGIFSIRKTTFVGLFNETGATFSNLSGGTVNIGTQNGSIGGTGIKNLGTITNNASSINIGNTGIGTSSFGWGGINQTGSTFNNINGATLAIGQNGEPVQNSGWVITNNASFLNSGSTLKIDNITGTSSSDGNALEVEDGTLENTNAGLIEIGQGDGNIPRNGIHSSDESVFRNNGSTINIDKTTLHGINTVEGADFLNSNNGQINIGQNGGNNNIGSNGINNTGSTIFKNSGGVINIDNTVAFGISQSSSTAFENSNNGQIIIGENGVAGNIGEDGITNSSTFNNSYGTIRIANTTGNAINNNSGGTFENINNGILTLGQNGGADNITLNAIKNNGIFNNNGSTIQTDNCKKSGIVNQSPGNFTNSNSGQILAGLNSVNYGAKSSSIENHATFTNDASTIDIESSFNQGIMCQNGEFKNINNGQIDISGTWGNGVRLLGPSNLTNSGTMSMDGIIIGGSLSNSGTLTATGLLIIESNGSVSGTGTYNLERGLVNDGSFTAGSSTVNMVGSLLAEISGTSETAFNLLKIEKGNNDAEVWVKTGFSTLQDLYVEAGHLLIESGIVLSIPAFYVKPDAKLTNHGHIDTPGRLDLDGIISGNGIYETGGVFVTGFNVDFDETATSTVILSGTGAGTFSTLTNHDVNKFVIDKTNPSTQVTQGNFIFFCKNFELKSGNFVQGANLFANNVLIETDGTWEDCKLSLSGDLVNNGLLNGGNLNLNGETETEISGNAFTIGLLRTNKSGAGSESLISTDINVTNQVNFNNSYSGILNISSGSTVTLENGATIANESNGRYFTGLGTLQTTVSLNAPTGENPGNIGVEINSSANLGSTTVKRYHQPQTINGQQGILRYYDISPANNSGLDATVKFHYLDHELNGWSESNLAAYRFNGSEWELYSATQNNTVQNYVETGSIDAFSIWTMASSSILPVELTHFSATKDGGDALLEWQTVSEINNEGFEVEHSLNGRDWDYLGFVEGQGNSTERHEYSFSHKSPSPGMNYYRLRQVDFDGQWEYSEIRLVEFKGLDGQIKLFPNPASSRSNIQITEGFEMAAVKVFDMSGRTVFEREWEGGEGALPLDVSAWEPGQYLIQITIDGLQSQIIKFIVSNN